MFFYYYCCCCCFSFITTNLYARHWGGGNGELVRGSLFWGGAFFSSLSCWRTNEHYQSSSLLDISFFFLFSLPLCPFTTPPPTTFIKIEPLSFRERKPFGGSFFCFFRDNSRTIWLWLWLWSFFVGFFWGGDCGGWLYGFMYGVWLHGVNYRFGGVCGWGWGVWEFLYVDIIMNG